MEITIDQALQKGVEAHKAGQVQEADRLYTAILSAQPKHPDANHNMAVLAVGVGKVQEALPFFKTALEANPNAAQFWLSYIDALIKLNKLAEAKAMLDQAKRNGARGDGFEELERGLEAIKVTYAVSVQSQDPPQPQLQPLIKLYSQGQHQQALSETVRLLEKFPNSVTLHNMQGAAYKGLGHLDAAIISFKKALTIRPDYAEACYNLGTALKDQGKLEGAIEAFHKAISIKPDYADAYSNMGSALKEQGKLEEAIEAYSKAVNIMPNNAKFYYNMGNALQEQHKQEEAVEAFNKAVAIQPDFAEAWYNMGHARKKQGKMEEAIQSFNKALSVKPDYAEAYNSKGHTLKGQGKLEQAIEAYNKAIAIKPDYADAHYGVASILFKQDDILGAIKNLNLVNSHISNSPLKQSFQSLPYKVLTELENRKKDTGNRISGAEKSKKPFTFPIIIHRNVEDELINCLYEMRTRNLNDTIDARYGSGKCSPDFKLFETELPVIEKVSAELIWLMEDALGAKVLFHESFFNILGQGGGTEPHSHIQPQDTDFDLFKYKYSLVYYLSVGDQNCTEPGTLKLYKPNVDILPVKGMCTLIPSTRLHSAIYGGVKDRIMIGCNFYAI